MATTYINRDRNRPLRTYSNRFAQMEETPEGTWLVYNLVTGTPIAEDGHPCNGDGRRPRFFEDYASARECMVFLTEQYRGIERGR